MTEVPSKPLRVDGRRNRERIIAAAAELVGRDGAQVSLEEVARKAGLGSATLHRHFASRHVLLEAVFHDGVAQLCERAATQPGKDPAAEMVSWLEELTVHAAKTRGMAMSLLTGPEAVAAEELCATDRLTRAFDVLVRRATSKRALRHGVTTRDLMHLANAISVATEDDPVTAKRLLRLALAGVFRERGTD